jgi:hypothetical protein
VLEVQLSKHSQEKLIVTFDGSVVRYFSVMDIRSTSNGGGIHVGHIQSIETTTRNGKHALLVNTKFGVKFSNDSVDAEALGKVNELVAQVRQAMQSLAL